LPVVALRSTAADPRCTRNPSAKGRHRVDPGRDRVDQVADLVGEDELVADQVARRPPRRHVRMGRLGDEDAAKAGVPASSVRSLKESSFIDSKPKARLPSDPRTLMRSAFFRPVANRVASKEASAPRPYGT
jgi:hypothetical protein